MRVVEIRRFGLEHLAVAERPDPEPGPGQILLKLRAASLNYRDLLTVLGRYNPKQPLPLIPGSDGLAEVEAKYPPLLAEQQEKYEQAMAELEAILERIESEEVDVDRLAEELRRAAELLEICRGKIRRAEVEVTQIVQALEQDGDETAGESEAEEEDEAAEDDEDDDELDEDDIPF